MGIYGVVSNVAGGQVVTTILIGMVAMLFTAVSYGRMARLYPSAGSAYTYVARELHPMLGYMVGWSMLMDYLLNPIICAIWCSAAAQNIIPNIPFAGMGGVVHDAFHRPKSAGSANIEPRKYTVGNRHEYRGGCVSGVRIAIHSFGDAACRG